MSSPVYRVRRATVDDLESLRGLWRTMNLPAPELERRVTEFQVAESEDGVVHGALGVEISGRQGRLHGEVFSDFALADRLREVLWQRVQAIVQNHGLVRLWTDESAPFWKQSGFQSPDESGLKKLPAAWATGPERLLTLVFRDEEAIEKALESSFALLKEEERRRTEKLFRQGRTIKWIATMLAILLAIFVVATSVRLLLSHVGTPPR